MYKIKVVLKYGIGVRQSLLNWKKENPSIDEVKAFKLTEIKMEMYGLLIKSGS